MLEGLSHALRNRQIINIQQVQQKYSIIKTIEVMRIFHFEYLLRGVFLPDYECYYAMQFLVSNIKCS